MPTGGRKTTGASLGDVLEGLLEAGVDFILVGGLAAVIQGAPVTTMDVDIVHSQSPENIVKLLAYLQSVEAVHRRLDDKLIEPEERELSGKGHVLLKTWKRSMTARRTRNTVTTSDSAEQAVEKGRQIRFASLPPS